MKGVITINLVEALQKQMNFCKNNERYKCGVYVKRPDKKKIVMEVISNLLPSPTPNREVRLVMSLGVAEARYRNGSVIRIIGGNDSARMQRFNGVIIDNDLDKEIIDCIIMPTLKPMIIDFEKYEDFKEVDKRIFTVSINMDDISESAKFSPSDSEVMRMLQEQRKMLNNICFKNGEYIKLEREYECMFISNEYNTAIRTIEKDNNKILVFNALGIPRENIEYKTEFVNKSKESYLVIQGNVELKDLNYENGINIRMKIDTDIYDGYDVYIENGLVFVRLHEIINEAPALKDYGMNE